MRRARHRQGGLAVLCGLALALGAATPAAQAAFDDPLFILRPELQREEGGPPLPPMPPPSGAFEGPCGLTVDAAGELYVSDYYHHVIDRFGADVGPEYSYGYQTQVTGVDPLDGPCALALGPGGRLYVNDFHRNVVAFATSPFDAGTVITGAPLDDAYPTGLAVNQVTGDLYVNDRTHIAVFDSSGSELGQIGSFGDGYGLALSGFPATEGFLYVPDAATETVKVYDPATDTANPVATIDGSGTPLGHFVSLRDAAIAVDDSTGEVYVADNLQPQYAARPETVVYVFSSAGAYEGRLKFSVENSLPPGLTVDNSATSSQGRVYVTSGNTERAAVYAYPPHAATANAVPLSSSQAPPSGSVAEGPDLGLAAAAASAPALTARPPVSAGSDASQPPATAGASQPTGSRPSHGAKRQHRSQARRSQARSSRARKAHR
jgi:hypothetical protein